MSYDELLRLRDAAAPLPWEGVKVDDLNCFVRTATGGCAAEIYGVWANAAYLFAAANAVPGLAARVRELEAVTPPELDDARPCPCCWPGCDGNADPRCRYRLCGTHCDADCGRGDKCPRSDAKREGA